jgi:DNA-binding winged helix-turn-helix (wHTH) protein
LPLFFDRFELLPESGELRKQGTLIHLAPQPFRVLMLLIQRAGQIVTREEIQAELWSSDTFVSFEQGINAAIRRIRFALNDRAETPRFLQTWPRRGYCFIAPVERIVAVPPQRTVPETAPEPWWRTSAARIALALTAASALLFATGRPVETSLRNVPKVVRVAISESFPMAASRKSSASFSPRNCAPGWSSTSRNACCSPHRATRRTSGSTRPFAVTRMGSAQRRI